MIAIDTANWRIDTKKWKRREKNIERLQYTRRQIKRECENERVFITRTNNWFIAHHSSLFGYSYLQTMCTCVYAFYDSITIIIIVTIGSHTYMYKCVSVWVLKSCPFVISRMIEILHETKNFQHVWFVYRAHCVTLIPISIHSKSLQRLATIWQLHR